MIKKLIEKIKELIFLYRHTERAGFTWSEPAKEKVLDDYIEAMRRA